MTTIDAQIKVLDAKGPVEAATLALVAADGTYIVGATREGGVASLVLPDDGEARTVFVAHAEHPGLVVKRYRPTSSPSEEYRFDRKPGVGSVLFRDGTGHVPGLDGRLNPIVDPLGRTYIYGDNVSFDGRAEQPFAFKVGKHFKTTDALRHHFDVTVLGIIGRTSLLQFSAHVPSRPVFQQSWTVPAGQTLPVPRMYHPEEPSILTLDGPDELVTTLRLANIQHTGEPGVVLSTLRDVKVRRHAWIGVSVRNTGSTDASFTATVRTARR